MSIGDQTTESFLVEARVRGRYLVRSAVEAEDHSGAPVLVGFHGYAENAERHLQALVLVPAISTWHVVAVQALHPFYNPKTGEVVAGWMTKLDREEAIADNISYVDRVVTDALGRLTVDGPLVFAGFSQGTAMAYRAALGTSHKVGAVVALAGDLPPEIHPGESATGPEKVLIGRGTQDEWYDEAKMESDVARLESMGSKVETCVFDGGHEWGTEFLSACATFLRSLSKS
ncbi:MAG: phospholipase [Acidobacteriota bacterium]|nr:phospholipase [Acidobacteriota bacterium]